MKLHPTASTLRCGGYPHRKGATPNAAGCFAAGLDHFYFKQKLPNYKVFDEKRYFEMGDRACVFDVEGRKIGLHICEDLWFPEPAAKSKAAGAQLLLTINASPYHRAQMAERYSRMGARVKEAALPLLYVHGVGGQDEIVFDGSSFALDNEGLLTYQAESFRETVDMYAGRQQGRAGRAAPPRGGIYRAP